MAALIAVSSAGGVGDVLSYFVEGAVRHDLRLAVVATVVPTLLWVGFFRLRWGLYFLCLLSDFEWVDKAALVTGVSVATSAVYGSDVASALYVYGTSSLVGEAARLWHEAQDYVERNIPFDNPWNSRDLSPELAGGIVGRELEATLLESFDLLLKVPRAKGEADVFELLRQIDRTKPLATSFDRQQRLDCVAEGLIRVAKLATRYRGDPTLWPMVEMFVATNAQSLPVEPSDRECVDRYGEVESALAALERSTAGV
jgi:hypothetical protein